MRRRARRARRPQDQAGCRKQQSGDKTAAPARCGGWALFMRLGPALEWIHQAVRFGGRDPGRDMPEQSGRGGGGVGEGGRGMKEGVDESLSLSRNETKEDGLWGGRCEWLDRDGRGWRRTGIRRWAWRRHEAEATRRAGGRRKPMRRCDIKTSSCRPDAVGMRKKRVGGGGRGRV